MKTFGEDLTAAPEVRLQLTNDLIRIQCVRIELAVFCLSYLYKI